MIFGTDDKVKNGKTGMNAATQRIHHAAMRLFAETGGSTLAVSDLAREAGLSRGTIYNNLDDPNALFQSVCESVATEFRESIEAVTAHMADPAERISAAIRLCVRRVHDDVPWGKFLSLIHI